MKAYLREAGWTASTGHAGRYHLQRGQTGYAMCSSRVVLNQSSALPVEQIPGVLSCMRSGCRQGWDAADTVAEHWEAPAEDIRELIAGAAVPQPVDREALAEWLSQRFYVTEGAAIGNGSTVPDWDEMSRDDQAWWYHQAGAVLAVLAGEQEQVER